MEERRIYFSKIHIQNIARYRANHSRCIIGLKEYYEIVDEARPCQDFFPTDADFFTEMNF